MAEPKIQKMGKSEEQEDVTTSPKPKRTRRSNLAAVFTLRELCTDRLGKKRVGSKTKDVKEPGASPKPKRLKRSCPPTTLVTLRQLCLEKLATLPHKSCLARFRPGDISSSCSKSVLKEDEVFLNKKDGTAGGVSDDSVRTSVSLLDENSNVVKPEDVKKNVPPASQNKRSVSSTSSMEGNMDKEEEFGLIRPSLIRQLRAILDEYPDNGQILKELLQNAEDARATEVKFLYDQHTFGQDPQLLHHPGLAEYQGPALYAFNNARFTEKDWLGIRLLQDSIKENDPMKVGRFGLGFKSVLHLTDLPSVLSGENLAVIDPHEKFFTHEGDKTTGYKWNLVKRRRAIEKIPHQIEPYLGLFGTSSKDVLQGRYQGTLFRFPLRLKPSKLCETVYNEHKITSLLKSFKANAHMLLIFLCSVEKVELYSRKSNEEQPKLQYCVQIAENCRHLVRKHRQQFNDRINPQEWLREPVTCTFAMTVRTIEYENSSGETEIDRSYFVSLYYAGGHMSAHMQELHMDPGLRLLPLVGVAHAVDSDRDTEGDAVNEPDGHVFCFLPLPVEQKSETGLPVHVNGYFSISQNRRHLKWPAEGQLDSEDNSVKWNICLLKEVLPKAYVELVKGAIQSGAKPNVVYGMLPDVTAVSDKWKLILEPFYRMLFQNRLVHTQNNGGSWIPVQSAIFDCLKESCDVQTLVRDLLLQCSYNIVKAPEHVLHALGAFSSHIPEVISPGLVRTALKFYPGSYKSLEIPHKISLLEYILKDHDYIDMKGIDLLPLKNGTFIEFSQSSSQVYIPSEEHPADLLPGLDPMLVANCENPSVNQALSGMADEGAMQVSHLNASNIIPLIKSLFKEDMKKNKPFTLPMPGNKDLTSLWLVKFWQYLCKHFNQGLHNFSSLPILPLNPELEIVVPLEHPSRTVLVEAVGYELEPVVQRVLEKLSVNVATGLPPEVLQHPQILEQYLRLPLAEDALDAVHTVAKEIGGRALMSKLQHIWDVEERIGFRKYLATLSKSPSVAKHMDFLMAIPVFQAIPRDPADEETRFIAARDAAAAFDGRRLPSPSCRETVIDIQDDESYALVKLLGLKILNPSEFLTEHMLPAICNNQVSYDVLTEKMSNVLDMLHVYLAEHKEFAQVLGHLQFIKTEKGFLEAPVNLYDPEDSVVSRLFHGESVFPTGIYATSQYLAKLRVLGIRTSEHINGRDILQSAFRLEGLSCVHENVTVTKDKSAAMVDYLTNHLESLDTVVEDRLLREWLMDICWIAPVEEKPEIYPNSLTWFKGETFLHKPNEVKPVHDTYLVGAVCPIAGAMSSTLSRALGIDGPIKTKLVVSQLEAVTREYTATEKAKYLAVVTSIYDFLQRQMESGEDVSGMLKEAQTKELLWNGTGFSKPNELVMNRPPIELTPYACTLPEEMLPFRTLYLECGVPEQCSEEDYINILEKIHDRCENMSEQKEHQNDLQISVSVLNHLKVIHPDGIMDDSRVRIRIPIQTEDGSLQLKPIIECTYCDVDWLQQGFEMMHFGVEDGLSFIHQDIPISTAEYLSVPTLMSRMLHAEELNISGFGQTESLTNRLSKLLEEYTDGLSIFKELIQNADDAGATEVKFLFDERTNHDQMTYLIDEGMKECQGPALWCYNNAVFTDTDFSNITKLGGATKEKEREKIGKFGLGFNSVYNVTDVPSFVSRESMIIFDPHTTHLGRVIRDRSRPGIKLDLSKNKTLIKKLSHQFHPYQGVFGLEISADTANYFDGTVFRLPLRTQHEASQSEIKSLFYNREEVVKLLKKLEENSNNLLLFTQSVQSVTVLHLSESSSSPSEATTVLHLEKRLKQIVQNNIQQANPLMMKTARCEKSNKLLQVSTILKATADFIGHPRNSVGLQSQRHRHSDIQKKPRSSYVLEIAVKGTLLETDATEDSDQDQLESMERSSYWLIAHCMGLGNSLAMASHHSEEGLNPSASVAVHLRKNNEGYLPSPLSEQEGGGLLYSYMPLPIKTGLPVHVNGMFATHSNRRFIVTSSMDDKANLKSEWNEALLEDAVCEAYIQAQRDLLSVLPCDQEISLSNLWPVAYQISQDAKLLAKAFYKRLGTGTEIPLASMSGKAVYVQETMLLEETLTVNHKVKEVVRNVFQQIQPTSIVLQLSPGVRASFVHFEMDSFIAGLSVGLLRFYESIFLPNISAVSATVRDELVYFALENRNPELDKLIQDCPCIPASPDGRSLKMISALMKPGSMVSFLFSPDDECFPLNDSIFMTPAGMEHLERIGLKEELTWSEIVQRAGTLEGYTCNMPEYRKRLGILLRIIDAKLVTLECMGDTEYTSDIQEAQEQLQHVRFLPVMPKPLTYPIQWNGGYSGENLVAAPTEMYTPDVAPLVSSSCPILDETVMATSYISPRVLQFLLPQKSVPQQHVVNQFEHALSSANNVANHQCRKEIGNICSRIYLYFSQEIETEPSIAKLLMNAYGDRECVFLHGRFVHPRQVALCGSECSPYLFGLTKDQRSKHRVFLKALGVKNEFLCTDYIRTLKALNEESQGLPLRKEKLDLSLKLVQLLSRRMKEEKLSASEARAEFGTIYMPDIQGVLRPSTELCFNDCPWITKNSQMTFTHEAINYQDSSSIGVKTKRQDALRKHSTGIPFGQKEALTKSLQRIISSYPSNHEILFELLQNADDAGATEIHFINDPRELPKDKLFDQTWIPLQGPALCVYNNRPFTEADMEGIQSLGQGSKSMIPDKTGQYGIGFSSVYHLTDVPSFMTSGPELGKTLCVFDPNCTYVPGATSAEPGMRYDDIDLLQNEFPDVFHGYLPELYSVENATMFRFPLRTKKMCESSEISNTPVSSFNVQGILQLMKPKLFDALLFLNNIKKIVLCDIDPDTGKPGNTYVVEAATSEDDFSKRSEFGRLIKETSLNLRNGSITIGDIQGKEIAYKLNVRDNTDKTEIWMISKRLGFLKESSLPENVQDAINAGDLNLLPQGGVACLLERRENGKMKAGGSSGNVFCFLPLPQTIELPVHINGHFALGHENRRHLWNFGQESGYQKEWNINLCTQVIARAYCNLLLNLRSSRLNNPGHDQFSVITCNRKVVESILKGFMDHFPQFSEQESQWHPLVQQVYQYISEENLEVLPSIQEGPEQSPYRSPEQTPKTWHVVWLPPHGAGKKTAFVGTTKALSDSKEVTKSSLFGKMKGWFQLGSATQEKSETEILQDVMIACGLNWLNVTGNVVTAFEYSGRPLQQVTPQSVITLLKTCESEPDGADGVFANLPAPLDSTPFKELKNLKVVIKYCMQDPEFLLKLDMLPIAYCSDKCLRRFDVQNPLYSTKYQEIVPECKDQFLHPEIVTELAKLSSNTKIPVLEEFTIKCLSEMLHFHLPPETFYKADEPIPWRTHLRTGVTMVWMGKIWGFIKTELKEQKKKKNETEGETPGEPPAADESLKEASYIDRLEKNIDPLLEWSVLPYKTGQNYYLTSISKANEIVDCRGADQKHSGMTGILKRLNAPEIDDGAMKGENADILKPLLTTPDKADRVLHILYRTFQENNDGKLSLMQCEYVLDYFTENICSVKDQEHAVEMLKSLPVYKTICGDIIALTGCVVYTLPAKIPTADMDIWQNKTGMVFLERKNSLTELYSFLGCASVDLVDVYSDFVFQHFEYLSPVARQEHLYHVYDNYLKDDTAGCSAEERHRLMTALSTLPLLEDSDGNFRPAGEFYDPNNTLFHVMLPQEKFPPRAGKHFKESEWINFLGMMGMVKEVTGEMVVGFSKQVALEAANPSSAGSVVTKSKALVNHLIRLPVHSRDALLPQISDIAFLPGQCVSADLGRLHSQYGDWGTGVQTFIAFNGSCRKKHEKLVWTKANILPSWADPSEHMHVHEDDLKKISDCLKIQNEPSEEIIVAHLGTLCENMNDNAQSEECMATAKHVFAAIYRHLQDSNVESSERNEHLKHTPWILVEGRLLVKPSQIVINLSEEDEIQPYLFRLPPPLVEFQRLFTTFGASYTASVDHYAGILECVYKETGGVKLLPTELVVVFKALKGLYESIGRRHVKDLKSSSLYLLSEEGCLVQTTRLLYNNAPAYYDRLQNLKMPFLCDPRECGFHTYNFEEVLKCLPKETRPLMLNVFVEHRLQENIYKTAVCEGFAKEIQCRLQSVEVSQALRRLIRHECLESGRDEEEDELNTALDRLHTIKVYAVDRVVTELKHSGKKFKNSERETSCFVEKYQDFGHSAFKVFVRKDASATQDLLVKLAEVVNQILKGMLGKSVLYLIPVLSCSPENILSTLDELHIRTDLSGRIRQHNLLPAAGSEIPEDLQAGLKPVTDKLRSGELVGYDGSEANGKRIYCFVKEFIQDTPSGKAYFVDIGNGKDSVIATELSLYKMSRAQ